MSEPLDAGRIRKSPTDRGSRIMDDTPWRDEEERADEPRPSESWSVDRPTPEPEGEVRPADEPADEEDQPLAGRTREGEEPEDAHWGGRGSAEEDAESDKSVIPPAAGAAAAAAHVEAAGTQGDEEARMPADPPIDEETEAGDESEPTVHVGAAEHGTKEDKRRARRFTCLAALVMALVLAWGGFALWRATEAEEVALIRDECDTSCHGLDPVREADFSYEGWRSTVIRMENHGADLTDEERDIIVEYLAGEGL